MKNASKFIFLLPLTIFIGCAGEDYHPVYFPTQSSSATPPSTNNKQPNISSSARCALKLTAKLCVKIKGEKFETGLDPAKLLCADTPEIPFEIEGEKILLKGSDFPDIHVDIDLKGVKTPLTINGKGTGDGSQNTGEGTWTPEGDIEIKNFSFFINVLGVSGEISGIDLTTGETKTLEYLPPQKGSPAAPDGSILLVAATTVGHLFPKADEYLLKASLQASFEGKISPPLSDCAQTESGVKNIRIVKTHLDATGMMTEEPLPDGNILEISKGTYIAQGPQDVGPSFEETAHFKATNLSKKPVKVELPSHIGPFYFDVEGKSKRSLAPNQSIRFVITFRPTQNDTPQPKMIKEKIYFGADRFFLSGMALKAGGRTAVNQIDDAGQTTASNVDAVLLSAVSAPAAQMKDYFRCQKIRCDAGEKVTQCKRCEMPDVSGCKLLPINTLGTPLEEVHADCKPNETKNIPAVSLELSGSPTTLTPSKQTVIIQNNGIAKMVIKDIHIDDLVGSKSTGQFQLFKDSIMKGTSIENARPETLPTALKPYQKDFQEERLFISIAYLPTDLLGWDGKQAVTGQDVIDKAVLKIETGGPVKKIQLLGRTRIQDIPDLQTYFGTATGLKAKAGNETFAMEEVTATTTDLAVPVFLKLADTANSGLRITSIALSGKESAFFEWLDTPEKVAGRQPPSGSGKRCSIPIINPTSGRQVDEKFDLNFVSLMGQGFDLKPGEYTRETMPLFGCLNFHKDPAQPVRQRLFKTDLTVNAIKLDATGKPDHNPDQSLKTTTLTIPIVAVIDPLKGKMVLRITQTIAAILNATSPSLAAMASSDEVDLMIREGRSGEEERIVMLGAIILDPFDEMELTDSKGRVVGIPGDGWTGIFRELDTRPTSKNYEDSNLFDFATLLYDSDITGGKTGIFYDYDFPDHPLPTPLKINGWRIFTGSLSYPGPLSSRSPIDRGACEIIDPCSAEGLAKFSKSGVGADDKGACAFFYTSGGKFSSPTFEPIINGQIGDLCAVKDRPQDLEAMSEVHYSVDGSFTAENSGLRFWGPTFIDNPSGPLGFKAPLDEVFHIAFTTETLKPKDASSAYNVLPEERINTARLEHKINLTQEDLPNPPICFKNTNNRTYGGKKYSSWHYIGPLLSKDESGEIPAECPDPGKNDVKDATAFLHGRRIDPQTGIFSVVSVGKFSPREDPLTFKNVTIFIALNGWLCNPQGDEKDFEGAKCFELHFNERDAKSQFSIIKGH